MDITPPQWAFGASGARGIRPFPVARDGTEKTTRVESIISHAPIRVNMSVLPIWSVIRVLGLDMPHHPTGGYHIDLVEAG
jgi:hypothetical protein